MRLWSIASKTRLHISNLPTWFYSGEASSIVGSWERCGSQTTVVWKLPRRLILLLNHSSGITATRFFVARRHFIGTILKAILTIPLCNQHIPTTSMSHLISSIIASLHPKYPLTSRICPFLFGRSKSSSSQQLIPERMFNVTLFLWVHLQ